MGRWGDGETRGHGDWGNRDGQDRQDGWDAGGHSGVRPDGRDALAICSVPSGP